MKYNIYNLRRKKLPLTNILICLVMIGILIYLLINLKIDNESKSYYGIYNNNNKSSYISTSLPIEVSKNLKENDKIFIDNKYYKLDVKSFGKIEEVSNVSFQNLNINIPKLKYFDKQMILFSLNKHDVSFINTFIDILKGGDEDET